MTERTDGISSFRRVTVTRVRHDSSEPFRDSVAAEAPLEVRVGDEPFSVIMRTPGADRDLAAGFLFSEGIIKSAADIVSMEAGGASGSGTADNIISVRLAGDLGHLRLADRRQVVTNSSCGLCGRVSIESLAVQAPRIQSRWTLDAAIVPRLPIRLREAQALFDETGGLHAAGLFSRDGDLLTLAEDVGRHNAVDKVVGRMLLAGALPLSDALLFVSGRTSYEIVQKAFLAGIPVVGAVSAPSTLAIELAEESGISLLGFVRGDAFNVYTQAERIVVADRALTSER